MSSHLLRSFLAVSFIASVGLVGCKPKPQYDYQSQNGLTVPPTCNGKVYACSDGIDNDGDGRIDALDGECVGACDNDEASFATGIPGDNKDPCKQDCFFDGNSGQGDDRCIWDLRCDPLNPGATAKHACPYNPNFKNCRNSVSDQCLNNCRRVTPNGCDCFGCCQVKFGTDSRFVFLGSGEQCSTTNPSACRSCTPVAECQNDCGECELCLGKRLADLPAHCGLSDPPPSSDDAGSNNNSGGGSDASSGGSGGGPAPSIEPELCADGSLACTTNENCPAANACVTGCCVLSFR